MNGKLYFSLFTGFKNILFFIVLHPTLILVPHPIAVPLYTKQLIAIDIYMHSHKFYSDKIN